MTDFPYLGNKISLISSSEIRYEGILYTIDTFQGTVTLAQVRSYGTEDRPTERPFAERDEIYDFIVFRGSDIKDIKLCNVRKPYDDPAIVEMGNANSAPPAASLSTAPPAAAPVASEPGPRTQLPPSEQQPAAAFTIHQPPPALAPVGSGRAGASGSSPGGQAATAATAPGTESTRVQRTNEVWPEISSGSTSPSCSEATSNLAATSSGHGVPDRRQNRNRGMGARGGAPVSLMGPRRGAGGAPSGGGGYSSWRGGASFGSSAVSRGNHMGGHHGYTRNNRTHQQQQQQQQQLKFDEEFDFEEANRRFAELATQLAQTKISGDDGSNSVSSENVGEGEDRTQADTSCVSGADATVNGSSAPAKSSESTVCYDRKKSFFDTISCDASADISSRRPDWQLERRQNLETFGVEGTRRGFRRGGPGGFNNRYGGGGGSAGFYGNQGGRGGARGYHGGGRGGGGYYGNRGGGGFHNGGRGGFRYNNRPSDGFHNGGGFQGGNRGFHGGFRRQSRGSAPGTSAHNSSHLQTVES